MRLRQWPGLSIQLLMAASAEEAGACVIQSVVIHAIEQSARAAGRFMNGLSTELLVFVQVGCRVFFEIGFGDFVQLERFALFGFPVPTHFYFLPATNFSISSRSLMSVASRCTLPWAAAAAYCVSLGGERLTRRERGATVDCRMAGSKTSGIYIEQSDWIMINATNDRRLKRIKRAINAILSV